MILKIVIKSRIPFYPIVIDNNQQIALISMFNKLRCSASTLTETDRLSAPALGLMKFLCSIALIEDVVFPYGYW